MNGNGKEYAIALFSIMLESDPEGRIYEDLNLVDRSIKENPDYLEFLVNPAIPKSERIESLRGVFEGRVCESVYSFLNVICEHRDMYVLFSAINEFRGLYEDYMNMADAMITSAVELTDDEKRRLVSKLSEVTGKKIRATYTIDKELIGGVSVTVDGKHFDGSVRKNLKNIKEVIS
ncbi:MAG: ATP synthase F1 subunit delta [Clostridiales bacterium]|nr:ATP synthase F1 subunit delta [Clostridiales bacterium]